MKKISSKQGFTLIEILVVVLIIGLLAAAVLVSIDSSRGKASLNSAMSAGKGMLPGIVACAVNNGTFNNPNTSGSTPICATANAGLTGANWPPLPKGFGYGVGNYSSSKCKFCLNDTTGGGVGTPAVVCDCINQNCQAYSGSCS